MSPKGALMTNSRGKWFQIAAIGLPLALIGVVGFVFEHNRGHFAH
jgi:hypothetical protein